MSKTLILFLVISGVILVRFVGYWPLLFIVVGVIGSIYANLQSGNTRAVWWLVSIWGMCFISVIMESSIKSFDSIGWMFGAIGFAIAGIIALAVLTPSRK